MIGLFLPRLRVVSLLRRQQPSPANGPTRPARAANGYRNRPFAVIRNNEGAGNVSTDG